MSLMNIAGLQPVNDDSYRYQMPPMIAKVEGRGNGIKTVINAVPVAAALHRSPAELTKYFGVALSSQSRFDPESERAIVNGAFTTRDLQEALKTYIEYFILCPNCRYPEVARYKIKGDLIFRPCMACGAKEPVPADHKLCTFIVNEHKKAKRGGGGRDKAARRAARAAAAAGGGDAAAAAGAEESGEGDKPRKAKKSKKEKKEKKAKKSKKSKKSSRSGEGSDSGSGDEDGGGEAKAEYDEDGNLIATLDNLQVDDSSAVEQAVEALRAFMARDPSPSAAEVAAEVRQQQTASALPGTERSGLYVRAALGADAPTATPAHAPVLNLLVEGNQFMQRHCVAAIERLCGETHAEILPSFPIVLKHLYDEDVLEEEILLQWAADSHPNEYTVVDDAVAEQLRAAAQPFVTWLEQAESGSDSDSGSDDEGDVAPPPAPSA